MAGALARVALLAAVVILPPGARAAPAAPGMAPALVATMLAAHTGEGQSPAALAATIGWVGAGLGLRLRRRRRAD